MNQTVNPLFRVRQPGVILVTIPHTGGGVCRYIHDWCIISRVMPFESTDFEKAWMVTSGVVLSYDESIQPGVNAFGVLAGKIFEDYKKAKEAVLEVWNKKQKEVLCQTTIGQ